MDSSPKIGKIRDATGVSGNEDRFYPEVELILYVHEQLNPLSYQQKFQSLLDICDIIHCLFLMSGRTKSLQRSLILNVNKEIKKLGSAC